jgi:hypothetical protein
LLPYSGQSRRGLTLRSRNHLDQNYKLSLHRLIFDRGVGAQQSEAEHAVEDEQAVDGWFLAVTVVEKRYVDAEHLSDLLEPRRADPVDALFVFLHLLKGEPEVTSPPSLRDACFPATETDSPPHLDVRVPGRSWAELGRTRPRFGLPAHWEIILQPKGDGKGGLGDYSVYALTPLNLRVHALVIVGFSRMQAGAIDGRVVLDMHG